MLRFIISALFLGLYLILGIPVLGYEWILGKLNKEKADIQQLHMVQWGFNCMLKMAGVKITIIGEENVPKDKAVLYVGNHRSFFDILLTYSRTPGLTGFVAKKEMLKAPLLRTWMKRVYCLFLDRENPKEGLKTILTAIDYVKSGISIFIFPEGTRCKAESDLEMLPFHDGSFKIATKTKCPIVPVALNNTSRIFEDHFPIVKPTHVVLEYCDPIYPDQLDRETLKHIGTYTHGIILETIKKNQALL